MCSKLDYHLAHAFGPWVSPYGDNGQMIITLHNYMSRQFHRTSNRGIQWFQRPNWYQIWQVLVPWAFPYWDNGKMIIIMCNYMSRQCHRTSNKNDLSISLKYKHIVKFWTSLPTTCLPTFKWYNKPPPAGRAEGQNCKFLYLCVACIQIIHTWVQYGHQICWSPTSPSQGVIQWQTYFHDDVIKWRCFPRYWPFVRGIHQSPVNSPHKGQWHGALIFSLICIWINGWVNNREAGDLRSQRTHYDVSVMLCSTRLTFSSSKYSTPMNEIRLVLAPENDLILW